MINSEVVGTGAKLAPSAIVSSGYFLGVSWDTWLVIATLVYTLLQIGWFVYEKFKILKDRRKDRVLKS